MGCFSTPTQGSTSVTADFLKQHGDSELIPEMTNNAISWAKHII